MNQAIREKSVHNIAALIGSIDKAYEFIERLESEINFNPIPFFGKTARLQNSVDLSIIMLKCGVDRETSIKMVAYFQTLVPQIPINDLEQLAISFGLITAKGKIEGPELMAFANRGLNANEIFHASKS